MDLCDDLLWSGLFIILNPGDHCDLDSVIWPPTICYAYITMEIILATKILNI
jgi:hypothetical protein